MLTDVNAYAIQLKMNYSDLDKSGAVSILEKKPNLYYNEIYFFNINEILNGFNSKDNAVKGLFGEYFSILIDKFCCEAKLVLNSRLDRTFSLSLDEIRGFLSIYLFLWLGSRPCGSVFHISTLSNSIISFFPLLPIISFSDKR